MDVEVEFSEDTRLFQNTFFTFTQRFCEKLDLRANKNKGILHRSKTTVSWCSFLKKKENMRKIKQKKIFPSLAKWVSLY